MFLDEVEIKVSSGKGGDGMMHFRREKYVPRGGPDGGDGGHGGDVVLRVEERLNTLSAYRYEQNFAAKPGGKGGTTQKTGKSADNLVLLVPPGTLVYDSQSGELLGDLTNSGQELVVAKGGRGGRGNQHFATPRNQAPRIAEKGAPGEEKQLRLELRLIADVGIVGVPNAGKSTLLAAVTNAKPKIAPYPFTTIEPNLGVAELDGQTTLVLADVPGLIEGAHMGVGLGHAFLRHIQRTRVLIHLLDGMAEDPLLDYAQINSELALFDEQLGEKPQVVALNKMDLDDVQARWPVIQAALRQRGVEPVAISAVSGQEVRPLLYRAAQLLQDLAPQERPSGEELPVYRLETDPQAFEVAREEDGWRVTGIAIERAAAMTYWEYDQSVRRFQNILERVGVEEALRKAGAKNGDTVFIGDYEMEWQD